MATDAATVPGPAARPGGVLRADRLHAGRLGALSLLLGDAVQAVTVPGRLPRLLDCGGGSGAFAVPLASAGAEVTVLDISADALATLRRRAAEAGVADRVHPLQGDAEATAELVEPAAFDLVLAHGLLDAVDDPAATVRGLAAAVRPGGLVSILVANPAAAVVARALAGDPAGALRELRSLDTARRVDPRAVEQLCAAAGLHVEARHGIGVFSELVPGATLDAPGAREALAELDAEAASRPPFADLAGRVHLRARRPAG